MEVKIGGDENTRVSCRLICLRVGEEVTNKRRMKLKKEATKKGRVPGAQSLELAGWTMMITNVPEKWIPSEMLWRIYSIRWQIELLFKQFKSILQVHHSNTGNVYRLKCEIYGKLIMATIISRIHGAINAKLWNADKRELSMDKFYKRMQERAFHLFELL
ncbi:MAG: transposase, partial [Planctomycetes bacterium]|nr:transposase [Planctomycetota bacterium]